MSIVAGVGGALLWRASFGLTGSISAAWFAWAAWALTVPFFFEAFSVFPDGLGATLVLYAALPLLDGTGEKRDRESCSATSREEDPRSRSSWVATGVGLALLPWVHTRFAIISAMLGLFLVRRLAGWPEGRANLAAFLAVPVASALVWFGFFRVMYGTFSPVAPYGGYTQSSPTNMLNGLPALLFDQQFGILTNAPVYGVCFIGMAALARRRPRLAIELSLTALGYLLWISAYHMWWAGSSAPARFAVPVLPLLVLPGAWLWKSARHAATRAMAVALLAVSVTITAAMVTVDGGRLAYNFRDGYSRFAEWLSPLVDLPQGLPSFFRQGSGDAIVRAAIWMVSVLLAWLALWMVERTRPAGEAGPALALATPVCLAVAAMLALTGVWTLEGIPGPTRETSSLSLLEHFDSRVRPNGINLARLAFVPAE